MRTKSAKWAMAVCLVAAASACGSGTNVSSCRSASGSLMFCIDTEGPQAADSSQMQMCMQEGNTWAPMLCSHAGAVGGCQQVQAGETTTAWYFAPETASQVQQLCPAAGLTFVNP